MVLGRKPPAKRPGQKPSDSKPPSQNPPITKADTKSPLNISPSVTNSPC